MKNNYNVQRRTITPSEALELVRIYLNKNLVCMGCREYEEAYVFFLAPPGSDPTKKQFVGGSPLVVNKRSGKITEYEDTDLQRKRWRSVEVR